MPFSDFDGQRVPRGRIRFAGTQACHRELDRDSEVVVLAVGTVSAITYKTFDELLTRLHAVKVGEAYVIEVDYVAALLDKLRAEAAELAESDEPRLFDVDPPQPAQPTAKGSALDQALAFAEMSEAEHPDEPVDEPDEEDSGAAGKRSSPFSEASS